MMVKVILCSLNLYSTVTDGSTGWMRSFESKFELFLKYLVSPVIC